ncbi:DUF4153 domain-containing protein [Butyrivibrio sp. WCD2001]|uniref:DUF4153 domain-containing protein n=1 Tax=Butyrivibrio sp. WCD2001 TaxID=1280681 RepID=UPI00047E7204|nr:DUF4153 domain-containing protein [Butyrivibrio sp. WCD2001]
MKIFEKTKRGFRNIFSHHPVSIVLFMVATLLNVIFYGDSFDLSSNVQKVLYCCCSVLVAASISALLCENIHLYHQEKSVKRIILYVVIMAAGIVTALIDAINYETDLVRILYDITHLTARGFMSGLFVTLIVLYLCLIIFFFYKKSGETFEMYVAKAFCGIMKSELLYVILAIGSLFITVFFGVLIFEDWDSDTIMRVQLLPLGFVAYPCAIAGLSDTEDDISKLGKAILNYVFVSIISIAYLIIYLYIIKIIIQRSLPSDEVFEILAVLFVFGIGIWTMAYGCAEGLFKKIAGLLPFLYIPFIILQVICMFIRIDDYGFTTIRYLEIMFIVFEVIYFALYTIRFFGKKDIAYCALFAIASLVMVIFISPFANARNVVTLSRKSEIEEFVALGDNATVFDEMQAKEAYKVISKEGGSIGQNYLKGKLTRDQIVLLSKGRDGREDIDFFQIDVRLNGRVNSFDVSSYDEFYIIYQNYGKSYLNRQKYYSDNERPVIDPSKLLVYVPDTEEMLTTLDLEDVAYALIEKDKEGASIDELRAIVPKEITTKEGYKFIPTSIRVDGAITEETTIHYMSFGGYFLR